MKDIIDTLVLPYFREHGVRVLRGSSARPIYVALHINGRYLLVDVDKAGMTDDVVMRAQVGRRFTDRKVRGYLAPHPATGQAVSIYCEHLGLYAEVFLRLATAANPWTELAIGLELLSAAMAQEANQLVQALHGAAREQAQAAALADRVVAQSEASPVGRTNSDGSTIRG